jgi:hypothetical protein
MGAPVAATRVINRAPSSEGRRQPGSAANPTPSQLLLSWRVGTRWQFTLGSVDVAPGQNNCVGDADDGECRWVA